MTAGPIFVVGCARSGSTMLADLLGAHSRIVAVPEWPIVSYNPLPRDVQEGRSLNTSEAARLGAWRVGPSDFERAAASGSIAHAMTWMVQRYLEDAPEPDRWVDHTPNHVQYTQALLAAFPDAKFIHMVRDPRAVVASVLEVDWGPETAISAARWWNREVAAGLAAEHFEGAVRVRYEDLLSDARGSLVRLFDALELPFDERISGGGGFDVPGYSAAQHELVGGPLLVERGEGWRAVLLRPRHVQVIERETSGLMRLLGYEPDHTPSEGPSVLSELQTAGREASKRIVSRFRRRLRLARLPVARTAGGASDDTARYLSGAELWGDDFSSEELAEWFADEAEASINLEEDLLRGDYPWAEQQRRHGFAHLPRRRWRHVVGFGSAFGVELRPLDAERASIIEATPRYEAASGLSFPIEYVMAQPSGDLALPDESADLVICFGALHHVPNVSHVLREFGRVLEPGGYLAMVEPITSMGDWRQPRSNLTPRERGLPLGWARAALGEAGLDIRNEALFGFAPIRMAGRIMKRSPYNSKPVVLMDELICKALRGRAQYHATSRLEKLLRPKTAMWVARRRPYTP